MGLANFHRAFIRDFSTVAEPLFRVLKGKEFVWESEQRDAFVKLKECLMKPDVLAIPTREGRFILDTDACDVAIGAELLQVQGGQERVIAYGSFALNQHQRRYCTTRKELLAVVRFTNHFRHYLLGQEFTLRTDRYSLQRLRSHSHFNDSVRLIIIIINFKRCLMFTKCFTYSTDQL